MKPENLIDAMNFLDDDLIEATEKSRIRRKKNPFLVKWLSLAACVALAVLVCVPLFNMPKPISPVETVPPETTAPKRITAEDLPEYANLGIYGSFVHEFPLTRGVPETYEELMADEEENQKIDTLYKIRITEVIDSDEAGKLKGWSKGRGDHNCTFYKGVVLSKYLHADGAGEKIIFRMPGTIEQQTEGNPPYAPGDTILAVMQKKEEDSDITRMFKSYAFLYDIIQIDGEEYAFARGQKVPELEAQYAKNLLADESISVVTTTASNPVVYYGAYKEWSIGNSLSVLWREIFGLPDENNVTWAMPPVVNVSSGNYMISSHGVSFAECPEGFEYAGTFEDGDFKDCKYYTNPDIPEWIYVYTKVKVPNTVSDMYDGYLRLVHTAARQYLIRYDGQLYKNEDSYTSQSDTNMVSLKNRYGRYIQKDSELAKGFYEAGTTLFEGYDAIPYEDFGDNRFPRGSKIYTNPHEPDVILASFSAAEFAVYYRCNDYFKPHPNYTVYENGAGVVKHVYGTTVKIDVGSGTEVFGDFTLTIDTELSDGIPDVGDIVEFSFKEYPTSEYRPLTFLKVTVDNSEEQNVNWDLPPHIIIDGEYYFEHGARSDFPTGYNYGGIVPDGEYKGSDYFVNPDMPEWIYVHTKRFETEVYAKFIHSSATQTILS